MNSGRTEVPVRVKLLKKIHEPRPATNAVYKLINFGKFAINKMVQSSFMGDYYIKNLYELEYPQLHEGKPYGYVIATSSNYFKDGMGKCALSAYNQPSDADSAYVGLIGISTTDTVEGILLKNGFIPDTSVIGELFEAAFKILELTKPLPSDILHLDVKTGKLVSDDEQT
jgi:hypothetical protein